MTQPACLISNPVTHSGAGGAAEAAVLGGESGQACRGSQGLQCTHTVSKGVVSGGTVAPSHSPPPPFWPFPFFLPDSYARLVTHDNLLVPACLPCMAGDPQSREYARRSPIIICLVHFPQHGSSYTDIMQEGV